ncbi:chromatin modification-related protein EAF7-domain-containing protein [Lipomyces orientalis]|uniref:Chromatin modification-related protein EAF7-domain-containing protein n=1 Tax=Lipomyces orientalis TaxID=1233043 RepID=A0ACC3TJP6_9ASCO
MVRKAEDVPPDAWNIEQETALFKAICRYKPVGINKHFLVICIGQMVNNASIQGPYLTMKGIWDKLSTLYNLEGLDELEDGSEESSSQSPVDMPSSPPTVLTRHQKAELEADQKEGRETDAINSLFVPSKMREEFSLPWEEFGDLMLEHATAVDSQATSPAQMSTTAGAAVTRGMKREHEASDEDDLGSLEMDSELEEDKESDKELSEEEEEEEREEEQEEDEEEVVPRSTRRRGRSAVYDKNSGAARSRPGRGRAGRRGGTGGRITRRHDEEPPAEEEDEEDEDNDEDKESEDEQQDDESGVSDKGEEEQLSRPVYTRGRRGRRGRGGAAVKKRSVPRRSSRQTKK